MAGKINKAHLAADILLRRDPNIFSLLPWEKYMFNINLNLLNWIYIFVQQKGKGLM